MFKIKSVTIKAAIIGGLFVTIAAIIYIIPWLDNKINPYELEIKPKIIVFEETENGIRQKNIFLINYSGPPKKLNIIDLSFLNEYYDKRYISVNVNKIISLPCDTIIIDTSSIDFVSLEMPLDKFIDSISDFKVTYKVAGSRSARSCSYKQPRHSVKYGFDDFRDTLPEMPDIERLHDSDTIVIKYKRYFHEYKNKKYIFDIWPSTAGIKFDQKGDSLYLQYVYPNPDSAKILPPGASDTVLFFIPKVHVPEELKDIIVFPTKYTFSGAIEVRNKNKRHTSFYSFDVDMRNKFYVLMYEN